MGVLINGKTPEEIKRILEWLSSECGYSDCDHCQYNDICYPQNGRENIVACDALALIEHLEAQQPKWISVEERLPEALVKVWMYSRRFNQTIQGSMSKSDPTLIFCEDGCDWNMRDITHWMPLPEPPKEESV